MSFNENITAVRYFSEMNEYEEEKKKKKNPINLHWEDNSSNLQDLIAQWKCLKHLET